MSVEVRPAAVREADEIAALAARTFGLACPAGAAPADIAAFIDAHLTPGHFTAYIGDLRRRVSVAVVDGEIVGYTMLILQPPPPDVAGQLTVTPTVELSKLYVDPGHHGGTVARALCELARVEVRAAGRTAMWLGTNQANHRAQRYYERYGFTRLGTKRFRLGDAWEDDFIYELLLE